MDMQAAIQELQETAIVMSGIEARQAAVVKNRGEWPEQHEKIMRRVELALAEATDKLNALIAHRR